VTITEYIFVDVSCTEFYSNQTKNAATMGKMSLTPLSKVWLSLHRFSAN